MITFKKKQNKEDELDKLKNNIKYLNRRVYELKKTVDELSINREINSSGDIDIDDLFGNLLVNTRYIYTDCIMLDKDNYILFNTTDHEYSCRRPCG